MIDQINFRGLFRLLSEYDSTATCRQRHGLLQAKNKAYCPTVAGSTVGSSKLVQLNFISELSKITLYYRNEQPWARASRMCAPRNPKYFSYFYPGLRCERHLNKKPK